KVFLVADPGVRARRRLEQMGLPIDEASVAEGVSRIEERDQAGSSREVAPLRQAEDAVLLDSADLGCCEQVGRTVKLARVRSWPRNPVPDGMNPQPCPPLPWRSRSAVGGSPAWQTIRKQHRTPHWSTTRMAEWQRSRGARE